MEMSELIVGLTDAIKGLDVDRSEELAREAIEAKVDPLKALQSVTDTLKEIGDQFAAGELFLVHMMIAADAAKKAIEILAPMIQDQMREDTYKARVLIGTVEGDIHDIGKNLVATFLGIEGYEVVDLGIDVPTETFVDKVRELSPDVVGLSALVTSTMPFQRDVIEALKEAGLRDRVKVIIGGSPVSESWAEEIGADALGIDAVDAVEKVTKMIK